MLTKYTATISREDLKKGNYQPVKVKIIDKSPLDRQAKEQYYHPAIVLFGKMFADKSA